MKKNAFEAVVRYAVHLARLSRQPKKIKVSRTPLFLAVGAKLDQECARRRRQIEREGGRTHYGAPIWELDPRNPRRLHGQ